MFDLPCSKCPRTIVYQTKKTFLKNKSKQLICDHCSGTRQRRGKTSNNTEWFRKCFGCDKAVYYSSQRNLQRADHANSICTTCKRNTPESNRKISITLTGRKYPNRASNTKIGKEEKYFRVCPGPCGKELGYVSEWACSRATAKNAVCNSCSNKIYKKSWNYVIKDVHIKKMAATKAGYSTFEEYIADLDTKKKYQRLVRKLTKDQPIHLLENYDKLRGLCGVDGAYQLDHIVSIEEGYHTDISPEQISDISNLQIIPWKDNLMKSKGNDQ